MGISIQDILESAEMRTEFLRILRTLAIRALNNTQILILRKLQMEYVKERINSDENGKSLNAILEDIGRRHRKSLSTLKMNAKILKELGLIEYGEKHQRKPVRLTDMGMAILELLEVIE